MTREIETWLWDSIGSVTIEWLTTEADDQTSLQRVTRQVSSLTILGVEMQVVEVDNKNNNNNNNNNSHDNVYGAVIVTKVIARVHPVHLMTVD